MNMDDTMNVAESDSANQNRTFIRPWCNRVIGFISLLLISNFVYATKDTGNFVFTSYLPINFVQNTISGTVTDNTGAPLPGASVVIVGTTTGTTTDFDGNYVIEANEGDVLQFSYIGFETQDVTVGSDTTLNVSLRESSAQLEEVVVIGFGSRKKKDLTGAISTVDAETIGKVQAVSPQYALQGNTAGVRVSNTSGDPNEAPQIFVRGIGTWNGDSQPLYVVDGQIIEPPRAENEDQISGLGLATPPNLFNLINPSDIESISVLKDASAAAIYGNRGANGVVLITTKKGKRGRPIMEFNTFTTFSNMATFDMLNTSQYKSITREMFANNRNPDITIENQLYGQNAATDAIRLTNFSPQFDPQSPFFVQSNRTYDWQRELVRRSALTQSHDLKISGASEHMDYYISGSYLNQEQLIQGNDLKRYTAAMNINANVFDWLKVGLNYKYTYQLSKLTNGGDLPGFADAAPWQPLRNSSHITGFEPVLAPFTYGENWSRALIYGQGSNTNQLAINELNYSDFGINRSLGQAYVEIKPVKNVTLRGSINVDWAQQERYVLDAWSRSNIFKIDGDDPSTEAPEAPNSLGGLFQRINTIFNYQSDFTATYANLFGKHSVNLTAAVQDQRHEREFNNLDGQNLVSLTKDPKRNGYSNDLNNNSSISGWDRRYWFGMVGRASYNYDSKYYLDVSFRRDASSGFDDDFRWGNFYSASGAWRVSSEKFMENVEFVNDLKFRGGYGEAGNDQAAVGAFAFLSGVTNVSSTRFGSGDGDSLGNLNLGTLVNDFPNTELSWETVITTSAGFDAILFDNHLNLTFEWYKRETDGILQTVQFPNSVQLNSPLFNIGKLENRGIDLQVGFNDDIGDFNYGISGNISFLKNEVTELFDDRPLVTGEGVRVEEGRSIGHIWGYQLGGIFQTQAEIDNYFAQFPDETIGNTDFVAPGDLFFSDVQGAPTGDERFYSMTPDGVINSFDQTEIGNSIPGYTYGLNLNASWKGFDFFAGFYGEGDVEKYNTVRARLESMSGAGPNYLTTTLNRWTPNNTNTLIPRAVIGDPAGNNRFSSRYVESAAYFRLNNWQIGYSLSDTVLESFGDAVRSLRFYVGGQNNIYISNWSGIDPVNDTYPLPKSITFGVNATF